MNKTTKTPQKLTSNPQSTLKEKSVLPKLTRKQKAFADTILNNPKLSATKAVQHTYNVNNARTASVIATENLAKPSIKSYLEGHTDYIEQVLVNTVKDYATSDDIKERTLAVNTGEWIHDKVHGKATQQIETRSQSIVLNIDLTGDGTPTFDQ